MKQIPFTDASQIILEMNGDCQNIENRTKFIIHDGPPYANGPPHVGHALNKILKDIIVRYKRVQGYDIIFNPGWDCHGLPIEMKSGGTTSSSVSELRKNAYDIATKYINIQKKAFQSWGISADWHNYYATYDYIYQSKEITAFNMLCKKNLVFRDSLPTYWSCSSKTALAEAELEYNDQHRSQSAFVKFDLHESSCSFLDGKDASLLIWTTTPWTLVANEAVGVKGAHKYVLCNVNYSFEKVITGLFSLDRIREVTKKKLEIVKEIDGEFIKSLHYRHPVFKDKVCPVLEASFVSDDKGTGIVHIAPAHGKDDFEMMRPYGKYDEVLVDNDGNFTAKCGDVLCGNSVLGSGVDKIIGLLGEHIFHQEMFIHSYPYDWRTKQPIITKLSTQWFIDIEKLSGDVLKSYENVKVSPESMKENMYAFIKNRPNWCISRQRKWGVPIPVLYKEANIPVVDDQFIEHISRRIEREGSDFWWQETVEEMVPKNLLQKWQLKASDLTKSMDIFDIWFDSGLSWWCTLPPDTIADLYLEGVDQFRGWFSSSLLMGVALKGRSPYKCLVTHGFTVDGDGHKMSKSLGNVIDPANVVEKYGVDVLRYWASAAGSSQRNNISDKILHRIESQYFSLRNMFRFILGNTFNCEMCDLKQLTSRSTFQSLLPQDRYILHVVAQHFINPINACYDKYQLEMITPLLEALISKVSNFYFTIIKDRLYCDAVSSESYKSCTVTLVLLLRSVISVCQPILPCLSHEVLNAFVKSKMFVDESFFKYIQITDIWHDTEVARIFEEVILPLRSALYAIDLSSRDIEISNKSNPMSELKIEIFTNNPSQRDIITVYNNSSSNWQAFSPLCEILRCAFVKVTDFSEVTLNEEWMSDVGGKWMFKVEKQSKKNQCARCRRYTNMDEAEECCPRCNHIMKTSLVSASQDKV